MDNRIFNVNGKGLELLTLALDCAFKQRSDKATAIGWTIDEKKGLIFLWVLDKSNPKHNQFLGEADVEQAAKAAFKWLQTEEAKRIPHELNWDKNHSHDGHNTLGWRVYCEDWGHVNNAYHAIVAVKPAWMWHGK